MSLPTCRLRTWPSRTSLPCLVVSTLSLHTYKEPDSVRVAVSGELDLSSALTFEEELRRIEDQSEPRLLVLDLRSLKFMDSTGLRLILSAHARAINHGRKLVIVQGSDAVRRIFRLTGVLERLNCVDDLALAGGR
jgi:anti-sigma B factor antagonist